jgi:RimJ/RimL family protein N-acetyltransferase
MVLRSARTIIRPWQRHDDDVADQWPPYNDPLDPLWNLTRSFPSDFSWGGLDFGMRRTWAVDDPAGNLMGRISLREVDERRGRARLGITFGAPYVSKGLGTEAMRLFLDHYFGDLNFQVMVLDVAAPNQRAVRSYVSLGFRRIGDDWRNATAAFDRHILSLPQYAPLRQFFRYQGHYLQVQFFEMELLKHEWLQRRQAQQHHTT